MLPRCLHEIHQLVDLKQRDERIQQSGEVAVHQTHQRRAARSHLGNLFVADRSPLDCAIRFVHRDCHIHKRGEHSFEDCADGGPIEPSKTAAQGRDGDRGYAARSDLMNQRIKASLDVWQAAGSSPVALSSGS